MGFDSLEKGAGKYMHYYKHGLHSPSHKSVWGEMYNGVSSLFSGVEENNAGIPSEDTFEGHNLQKEHRYFNSLLQQKRIHLGLRKT